MPRSNFKDLCGQRFGRLIVIERVANNKHGSARFLCKCDCGNYVEVDSQSLKSGNTKSCGCFATEVKRRPKKEHPDKPTRLYGVWCAMKRRCYNKQEKGYKNYGGRGISVCDEWKSSFQNFKIWAMENGYRQGLSIDRIDVNGNYCPENCRWADSKTQANNTTANRILEYNEEKHTLAEWSRITGLSDSVIRARLDKHGCSIEQALTLPLHKDGRPLIRNKRYLYFTINGITKNLKEWAEYFEISYRAIGHRIRRGQSFDDALKALLMKHNDPKWTNAINAK